MSVELIGPFKTHAVAVNGYRVPFLDASPMDGGTVALTLDHRYGLEVPVADLDATVEFIANCIAVAAGFTCHPGTEGAPEPVVRTGYGRMLELG